MKILILCVLGIVIYLLIGIIVALLTHLLRDMLYINPDDCDNPEILIFLWPLFLIGIIFVGIVDVPVTFYNKMIDKIDKAYEEKEDEANE